MRRDEKLRKSISIFSYSGYQSCPLQSFRFNPSGYNRRTVKQFLIMFTEKFLHFTCRIPHREDFLILHFLTYWIYIFALESCYEIPLANACTVQQVRIYILILKCLERRREKSV